MKPTTIALVFAAATLSGAALAQTVAPQPAPAAQRAAPPDKYGPPIHARTPSAAIKQPETTGTAPKSLSPGASANTPSGLQPGPLPAPQDRRQRQ
jgi:hypothetical protein